MTDTLLSTGIDRCRRAGAAVTRSETAAEPPAVARSTSEAAATDALQGDGESPTAGVGGDSTPTTPEALLTGGSTVAIEPLPETDPTTVLSRLWNNRTNDRATLFVVPSQETADAVEELLSPPVGAVEMDDGRQFHTGPDRVPLDEGGYAAVPTGDPLVWRESSSVPNDPTPSLSISGDGPESPTEAATTAGDVASDTPWLELRAGETVLARLEDVDALACPPRARFPYAYHRDQDKQIRVLDFAGRPVQRYTGIEAMRHGGFRPVPAPLVPEHMFDGPTAGWWAVLPATA